MTNAAKAQAAQTDAGQKYVAILKGGQNYVFRGQRFEFNTPQVIDQDTYEYLRRNAMKSVKQGTDDEELRRVRQPFFEFKKVRAIVNDEPMLDEEEEDELEEVELTDAQMAPRARLQVREGPVDVDAEDRAPGARTRVAPGSRARSRAKN